MAYLDLSLAKALAALLSSLRASQAERMTNLLPRGAAAARHIDQRSLSMIEPPAFLRDLLQGPEHVFGRDGLSLVVRRTGVPRRSGGAVAFAESGHGRHRVTFLVVPLPMPLRSSRPYRAPARRNFGGRWRKAGLDGVNQQLVPGPGTGAFPHLTEPILDGTAGNSQVGGDVLVAKPAGSKLQHLNLPARQARRTIRPGEDRPVGVVPASHLCSRAGEQLLFLQLPKQ